MKKESSFIKEWEDFKKLANIVLNVNVPTQLF